jgi:two-component system response regulator YesN
MELLEENFSKNKQMFIEKQLNTFLIQSDIKESDLNMMRINGVDLSTANYMVGIIEFYNSSIQEIFKSESFIRDFISNAIKQYEFIIPFSTSGGLGIIIKNDVLYSREVEYTISKLIRSKNEHDEVSVRVSLSSIFSNFTDFSSKFKEASSALSISRFTNAGNVISYDDIEETTTLQAIMTIENIKEIDYIIRFESENDINDIFERHIKNAKIQNDLSVDYQLYIITNADIILRYALSLGIEVNQYFKGGLLSKLLPLTSIVEVLEFTRTEIIKLRKCIIDKGNSRINEIAKAAFLYIDMNFADSTINLDKVSEHFKISVSYLSSLLKKEKNISFNKYLIQLRITKAKELLKYSDLKVIEVAEKVGYNDVYYFSHSFKKNTTMSPKEYRENE